MANRTPILIAIAAVAIGGSAYILNRGDTDAPVAGDASATSEAVETAAAETTDAVAATEGGAVATEVAAVTDSVEEAVEGVVEQAEEVLEVVETSTDVGLEIDVAGEANGTIVIDLFEDVAPLHVAQIAALATEGFYDGVVFHRVIDGFMAQTGDGEFGRLDADMRRAGTGGSSLPNLQAEFSSELSFTRGVVGMARSQDPNSANSQFFIMFADGAFLDGQYTIVGEVTEGLDVLDAIKRGEGGNGAVLGQPDLMEAVRVTQ